VKNRRPTETDRIVSHLVVGLVAGALVGQKTGLWGFIIAGVLAAVAHELLDAPLAGVIAEISPL
jgi:hypothetical protein